MIITYENSEEILIATEKQEKELIKLWFTEGGRDLDDYDREEHSEPFSITPSLTVR